VNKQVIVCKAVSRLAHWDVENTAVTLKVYTMRYLYGEMFSLTVAWVGTTPCSFLVTVRLYTSCSEKGQLITRTQH